MSFLLMVSIEFSVLSIMLIIKPWLPLLKALMFSLTFITHV